MALNVGLPHIPDLVMCQIIRLLPTKDVVRMSFLSKQWEDVLSSVPVLDFDECGERRPHNFDPDDYQQQQQHVKFIDNILTKYLELYEKDKHKESLEKFRLRMMYSSSDTAIVDKLLNNSFDRGVKELDISLRVSKSNWNRAHAASYHCFCLSPTTLANAKSLTTLKLEYMRIKESLKCDEMKLPESDTPLLPSLKIMSFKNVHFNFLYSLIRECPSIEHLSLISCSFDKAIVFVSTSSLKSLEVKYCKAGFLHVQDDAKTLESLTFVSTRMRCIMLGNTHNLRHINIHSRHLKGIFVYGCHSSVKATIHTPDLIQFDYYGYFMKSKIFMRAPRLSLAMIVLREIWSNDKITNDWSWEYFSALRGFLKEFDRCRDINLFTCDLKALTFPEDFRRTFSCTEPLPSLARLTLTMPNPPKIADVPNDFMDSCTWMAPSSKLNFVRSNRVPTVEYVYR